MTKLVTAKCTDNSGVCFQYDGSTQPMSNHLTIGKEYTGRLDEYGNFATVDDTRDTGIFDAERFVYVY